MPKEDEDFLIPLRDAIDHWKNPTKEMLEPIKEKVAWREKVESKMTNPEEFWKMNHTVDQMIGILREVATGEDPHSSKRRSDLVDWAYRTTRTATSPRDELDAKIRDHLENQGPFNPIRLSGEEVKG
jgi:hypothetical protein